MDRLNNEEYDRLGIDDESLHSSMDRLNVLKIV